MEHQTATLGQMKIKKSLNVQVSINFILDMFSHSNSFHKDGDFVYIKAIVNTIDMYFKFLVSIKFHA